MSDDNLRIGGEPAPVQPSSGDQVFKESARISSRQRLDTLEKMQASGAHLSPTQLQELRRAQERLNKAEPGNPQLVEEASREFSGAEADRLVGTLRNSLTVIEQSLDAVDRIMGDAPPASFPQGGGATHGSYPINVWDDPETMANTIDQIVKFLAPSNLVGFNISIQNDALQKMDAAYKEAEAGVKTRQAGREARDSERGAVTKAADEKSEMYYKMFLTKVITGVLEGTLAIATGFAGIYAQGMAGEKKADAVMASRAFFERWSNVTNQFSQTIRSMGEAITSFYQSEYETKIAKQEALRILFTDILQQLNSQYQSHRDKAREMIELLRRIIDELAQISSGQRRSAGTIGIRSGSA